MAITAAQLMVKVGAETKGAEAGLGRVSGMLGPGGPLLLGVAAAGAAVAVAGIAAVHMAGDFQESMTQLVTGAGESRSNLQLVSSGILQMAKDTGTSTDQLAQGMYMVESAGYHGAKGLDVLKAAAQGAKVGNADLGTVADATTTIMTDFAGQNVSASQAVNTLVATVAQGKTHMEDLSGALASALPTAASYRVHLNDVMGALSTMTAAGIPAADAATYLRQTLIGLGSPTASAAKALASVGLTTSQVNAEMQKSLPATLQMITDAVGKKFPAGSVQYNEAIKAIAGGSKQMQGMLALTGDHLATFQTDVGNISQAVQKGGASIQGWSDIQGDFNFKLAKMGATFQSVMITMGTKLLPVAGRLVDAFGSFLPGAFDALSSVLGPLLDALASLFGSFGSGEKLVSGAKGGLSDLAKTVGATVTPWISGLARIFKESVLPAISSVASFFINTLLPAQVQFAQWVGQNVIPVVSTLAHVFVTDILPTVEAVAQAFIQKLLPPLENIMGHVLPVLNPLFQTLGFIFKNVLGPAAQFVIGVVGGILNVISGIVNVIGGVINGIKNFVGGIIHWFQHLFDALVGHSIIPDLIKGIVGFFTGLPGKILGIIAGMVGKVIGFFAGLVGKALGFVGHLVGGVIGGIGHMVGNVVGGVAHMAAGVVNGAKNLAVGAAKHVAGFVSGAVSGAKKLAGGFLGWMGSWFSGTANAAKKVEDAIKQHAANAHKAGLQHGNALATGWLASILHLTTGTQQHMSALVQAAIAHTDQLKLAMLTKTAQTDVQAAKHFDDMRQKIQAALATTTDESKRRSLEAQLAIVTAAEKQKIAAAQKAREMAQQVAAQLHSMADSARTQGQQMMQGLQGGMSSMLGSLLGTVGNIGHSILGGITSFFGIHSPSTVFAGIGRNLSLGLIQGVQGVNVAGAVQSHMSGASAGLSGLPAGMSSAYGAAHGTMNGQPIQVVLMVDGHRLAQIVTRNQPSVIRNATGARNF